LTVNNPSAGTPAQAAETVEAYRVQVTQGFQTAIQGWQTQLKSLLQQVPGVSSRLISIIPVSMSSNWEVICGGGDVNQVAGAIYAGTGNIGVCVGSQVSSGRNLSATLYDAPNEYTVTYVNPPQATVTVAVTWNTTLPSFTAADAVNQYIIGAVLSYINSIPVGQPINLLVMDQLIQTAVSPVLSPANLTTLTYAVTINSTPESPTSGTHIIPAPDNETYLYISPTGATSAQG
jgi:hypothetical protein